MPSVILIAVPVGIFVALIFLVLMYTWKEGRKEKFRTPSQPTVPPGGQRPTMVYTIPTVRQLEVMFPNLTDVTVIQYNDQLPPPYNDVSTPPPSYDQIQMDVRALEYKDTSTGSGPG